MKTFFTTFLLTFCIVSISQNLSKLKNDKKEIDNLKKEIADTKNDSIKCINLFKLSDIYDKKNDQENRKLYKSRATKLVGNNDYLMGMSYFYNSIESYLNGDYKNYLKKLILANNYLKKYKSLEVYSLRARIYRNIAVCYQIDNNEKLALKVLIDSSIPLAKKSNDSNMLGAIYSSIGVISSNNQDYKNSEYYHKKAIEVQSKTPNINKKSIALSYFYLAHVLAINNKGNEAKKNLYKAKKYVFDLDDQYLLSYYYKEHGYLNHHFKEYKEAILNFDKAIKYAEKAKNNELISSIKITKSNTLTKLNKLKESRELLLEALKMGESTPSDKIEILKELADLSKKLNDFPKATVFYESLTKLNDSIKEIETKEMITKLEVKFRSKESQEKIRLLEIEKSESELRKRNYQLSYLLLGLVLITLILIIIFLLKNSKAQKKIVSEIEKNNYQNIININNQKEIEVMQAMIEGEESERKRIARDLHDGIGSRLSLLKMQLEQLDRYNSKPIDYKKILNNLGLAIKDLRQTAFDLVPETLSKFGLELALKDLCISISDTNIKVQYFCNEIKDNILHSHQINIFRIVQELLNNALKHSQCSEIIVDCSQNGELFLITVEDDGIGFNSNDLNSFKGLGLKNIRNRVDLLNGTLDVKSVIFDGTVFNIELKVKLYEKK